MHTDTTNTGTSRARATMADIERPEKHAAPRKGNIAYVLWMGGLFLRYLSGQAREAISHDWKIFEKDMRVFLGTALFIIGFFGFESSKHCDGNTTDYLSCTRPSTYYYYDSLDVLLMILGSSLILFWVLRFGRGK